MEYTVDEILASVKGYAEPAKVDYMELVQKDFPDDAYMMEGLTGQYEQEERYGIIVWMNSELRRHY